MLQELAIREFAVKPHPPRPDIFHQAEKARCIAPKILCPQFVSLPAGPLHDIGESYAVFFQQCPMVGDRRFFLRFSQPGGIECPPETIARICKIEAFLNRQKRRVQTYGQYAQIGVDIVRESGVR